MGSVKRIYVEKKKEFAVAAKELMHEIRYYLNISRVSEVRSLIRYDIENISENIYKQACACVFSEPPVDDLYEETFPVEKNAKVFSVEYLPGQFDQRADSAIQCVKFLKEDENPIIQTAITYVIMGDITEEEFISIKAHCINPVDSRETSLVKPDTLESNFDEPADVKVILDFIKMKREDLQNLYQSLNLAMTFKDFMHIQYYFKEEKRNPTMTEIRVLDTYWSDHCRHTTFSTELKNITFENGPYTEYMKADYHSYLDNRKELYKDRENKYICLMDLALIAMRKLKKMGKLADLEESEEINACSIIVPVDVDGKEEEWIVSFKNETHNHPTEIEPFGGAATCLGGAIRDPLSGRSYVYQAMRITGAADPTVSASETLKGKLPQKKIVTGAANGYSSYGNQIGLATGYVKEIYHPNYVAKRMEIGAVIGAAKKEHVVREASLPGDIIILLGGRTGRDGCGGATGSSKVHTEASIEVCGAEVQKGNAPTERKIQRLFRRGEVSRLIKKCNDFGAGGVSVAIGELADGLRIYLDRVPKKYAGLDGTEMSISESQERMAVVVDKKDVEIFLKYAEEENLEAVWVAEVTEEKKLVMMWRDREIVNLSRAFLDTNGAHQEADVCVQSPDMEMSYFEKEYTGDTRETWLDLLADLNVCSQKGLVEMFDSSIGAGTVLMPYGGKYQLTETQTMIAKVPVINGETNTTTMMSYGFNPYLSSWSPYHGAIYAVLESVSKIVASGGDYQKIRFTFQEYFKRMSQNPVDWGLPFMALLGAYNGQMGFGLPSIGGKDSMSGTFNDIHVPPTLVSFAVSTGKVQEVITPELKKAGNLLVLLKIKRTQGELPDYEKIKGQYSNFYEDCQKGKICAAYAVGAGGIAEAVSKMAFGNKLGFVINDTIAEKDLFDAGFGCIIAEVEGGMEDLTGEYECLGSITEEPEFVYRNVRISLEEALSAWKGKLETIFPTTLADEKNRDEKNRIEERLYKANNIYICKQKVAYPRVFIPVFPGTNCEYDSAKAFEMAGARANIQVFNNLNAERMKESVLAYKAAIEKAQILMFPGGFSAGDEPDGSAKFFAAAFRNEILADAVMDLLYKRDGLVLGICNGFQALIKLGLLPYGEVVGQRADSPTLTFNTIGRHISKMAYTKVVSNKSPWLQEAQLGQTYANPVSHGEGRFVAKEEWVQKLFENGQVATQYSDMDGNIMMDSLYNVNGSYYAIEGITSPDGRILGKMAHSERKGNGVAKNIFGEQDMKIFEAGVAYFK